MPPPRPPPRRSDQVATTTPSSTSGAVGVSVARKEDNIYIPAFISKQPFYLGGLEEAEEDSLQHQRSRQSVHKDDDNKAAWADPYRVKKSGATRTKWVKGACENCGALGHKQKDCLDRPRKVGAKVSGKDIQADRTVRELDLGYDAKRDVYHAYDPRQFREVVEQYELVEEARRQLQEDQNVAGGRNGGATVIVGEEGEETGVGYESGFKYAEESDMGRDRATTKQSMRIREDTAKYLLNLDGDSAQYNPKKRALIDGGALGAVGDRSAALFVEESFLRKESGEAAEFERAQRYAWEEQERSGDTSQHLQANPTAGAILRKQGGDEREAKRLKRADMLAAQYGEQATLPESLREMAAAENEAFVEYDEAGLIKGAPRQEAKSKYPEDVFPNNHTSVWGSWWSDFKWGYACCHSFVKNSYCTGDTGKLAKEAADQWDRQ